MSTVSETAKFFSNGKHVKGFGAAELIEPYKGNTHEGHSNNRIQREGSQNTLGHGATEVHRQEASDRFSGELRHTDRTEKRGGGSAYKNYLDKRLEELGACGEGFPHFVPCGGAVMSQNQEQATIHRDGTRPTAQDKTDFGRAPSYGTFTDQMVPLIRQIKHLDSAIEGAEAALNITRKAREEVSQELTRLEAQWIESIG